MASPAPAKNIAGCTRCSEGLYWCQKGVIDHPGIWYDGQAAQVSTYRVAEYDPVEPAFNVDGTPLYWRQLAESC